MPTGLRSVPVQLTDQGSLPLGGLWDIFIITVFYRSKLSRHFEAFTNYVNVNMTFNNTFPGIYIHCKVSKDLYKL